MNKIAKQKTYFYLIALYSICVYGPMAMMSIGAGLVALFWLGLEQERALSDLREWPKNSVFLPTLLLFTACFGSLLFAKFGGLEFLGMRPNIRIGHDLAKSWHLFFPFLLAICLKKITTQQLRRVTKLWIYLGLASALFGIFQYYFPVYQPMRLPHLDYETYVKPTGPFAFLIGSYHATGFSGFHLSYASIMAFPTMVWLALLAVVSRREGFSKRSRFVLLGTLLCFIATVLSFSKIAWLSLPLSIVLLAGIGFKGRIRYVLIGCVLAVSLIWGTSSQVRLRFQGTDAIKERVEVWSANVEMIRAHPIIGVGWHHNSELSHAYYASKGIKGFESHAHNNILDQWASTGLFGLIALLWLNAVLVWMAYSIYTNTHDLLWRSLGLGLVAAWFCLHLNGLTQANWWDAKVLHQISWVTALSIEVYSRFVKNKR